MITPATLPARHSKSLDQLGPEISTPLRPRLSPKSLSRSASTQLFSKHRDLSRTSPGSLAGKNKHRMAAPSYSTLFTSPKQAYTQSLGSTPILSLPRAKSTQILNQDSSGLKRDQSSSISSLLAAMFPDSSSEQVPSYRAAAKSSEINLTLPRYVKTLNLSQLANCLTSDGKNANYDEGNFWLIEAAIFIASLVFVVNV